MKKFRILSGLLAIVLLLMTGFTVSFAETAAYTEAEVLAGTILSKGYDFSAMTQTEIDATYSGKNNSAVTVTKVDGGVAISNYTSTEGYIKLNSGIYSFDENSALKVTFVQPKAGNRMVINIFDGTNRCRIHTSDNKINFGSVKADSPVLEAGQEYTLIAKKNGGVFSCYVKNASGSYDEVISGAEIMSSTTSAQFRLGIEGSDFTDAIVYKSVEQYEAGGTKEEILGATNAVMHKYDFDANYDGSANGASLGGTVGSANGLDYSNVTGYWQASSRTIPAGGAAAIRFKINNSSLQVYIGGSHGRAILIANADGTLDFKDSSNVLLDAGSVAQNTWYTALIKDNGEGYDLYLAQDEAKGFKKKLSSIKGNGTGTVTQLVGTKGTYIDYYTLYTTGASDVPTSAGKVLLHENGQATATYTFFDAGIPAGGYAEYSFKGENLEANFRQNSGQNMIITYYNGDILYRKTSGNGYTETKATHSPNIKYVYRIARNLDNEYSVWRKTDGDDNWIKLFEDITDMRTNTNSDAYAMTITNATVDYVKVYAPAKDGLLVVDGANTTSIINNAMKLEYATELKVIANSDEDGIIIIALYDANNVLQSVITEPVTANAEKIIVKDVTAGSKAQVFLWNSLGVARPLDVASARVTVK